ncbi:unnamed protein product [Amoebophrya sp. A120]|nr:unnamed protein product [Amoebophrya sp. A120]|eukprot:GSA120T00023126001.1
MTFSCSSCRCSQLRLRQLVLHTAVSLVAAGFFSCCSPPAGAHALQLQASQTRAKSPGVWSRQGVLTGEPSVQAAATTSSSGAGRRFDRPRGQVEPPATNGPASRSSDRLRGRVKPPATNGPASTSGASSSGTPALPPAASSSNATPGASSSAAGDVAGRGAIFPICLEDNVKECPICLEDVPADRMKKMCFAVTSDGQQKPHFVCVPCAGECRKKWGSLRCPVCNGPSYEREMVDLVLRRNLWLHVGGFCALHIKKWCARAAILGAGCTVVSAATGCAVAVPGVGALACGCGAYMAERLYLCAERRVQDAWRQMEGEGMA